MRWEENFKDGRGSEAAPQTGEMWVSRGCAGSSAGLGEAASLRILEKQNHPKINVRIALALALCSVLLGLLPLRAFDLLQIGRLHASEAISTTGHWY
jgi:hypothetical protein